MRPLELEVEGFEDLLVHFMQRKGAHIMLRGLRPVMDFDYDHQLFFQHHFVFVVAGQPYSVSKLELV